MLLSLARPLSLGVGTVSQWFGENPDDYAKFQMSGHNGGDYKVARGTRVYPMHDGTVLEIGWDPLGYGNYVRIKEGKVITIYAHLDTILAHQGSRISMYQVLGLSGNTGNSTGPHLHVGLKIEGMKNPAYRNWIDFVPFRDIEVRR